MLPGILSSTSVQSGMELMCDPPAWEAPNYHPQHHTRMDKSSVKEMLWTSYLPMLVVKDTAGHYLIPLQWFIWDYCVSNPPWSIIVRHNPGGMTQHCSIIRLTEVGWKDIILNCVPGEHGTQLKIMSDQGWNSQNDVSCSCILQKGCNKCLLDILACTTTVLRWLVTYINLPLQPSFKVHDPGSRRNIVVVSLHLILRDTCMDMRCSHCQCTRNI
jgi:hypothetical protein